VDEPLLEGPEKCHVVLVDGGDLLLMSGESRYNYSHEIPYTKILRWVDVDDETGGYSKLIHGPIDGSMSKQSDKTKMTLDETPEMKKFKRVKNYKRISITMRHVLNQRQ
jgi:hypothetical protein